MAEEGETQKPNIAARERGKTKVENSRKSRRKVGSLRVGAAPTNLSGVIKSIQNQSAFLLYSQRPFESGRGILRAEFWNERLLRSKTCVFQTLDLFQQPQFNTFKLISLLHTRWDFVAVKIFTNV